MVSFFTVYIPSAATINSAWQTSDTSSDFNPYGVVSSDATNREDMQ